MAFGILKYVMKQLFKEEQSLVTQLGRLEQKDGLPSQVHELEKKKK